MRGRDGDVVNFNALEENFEREGIRKARVVIPCCVAGGQPLVLAWYGGTQVDVLDLAWNQIDLFNHSGLGDIQNRIYRREATETDLLLKAIEVMWEHAEEMAEEAREADEDEEYADDE